MALLTRRYLADPAADCSVADCSAAAPDSAALAGLRWSALQRLMERHQQLDPFRFLVYAEQAGGEIGPVG